MWATQMTLSSLSTHLCPFTCPALSICVVTELRAVRTARVKGGKLLRRPFPFQSHHLFCGTIMTEPFCVWPAHVDSLQVLVSISSSFFLVCCGRPTCHMLLCLLSTVPHDSTMLMWHMSSTGPPGSRAVLKHECIQKCFEENRKQLVKEDSASFSYFKYLF